MPSLPDFTSLERLGSPIHLADPCVVAPPPSETYVPSSRRRSKATSHSIRRRRLAPRVPPPPSHAFDDLPWISTLDAAPELLNPWDIADLSLLPTNDLPSSGPGPVRRRKTSLRSSPVAAKSHPPSSPGSPLPIRDTSLLSTPSSVSTPRSRFLPSRVLFHNLMPVSCDSPF
ncbi:hypothetical protein CVT26_001160 [Gymnopilus dilepis]|uniref:Uncharacterized protein n=1 Tax=Gymnopilus dilepis TaxID=231916 RepID=A0A409YLQ7_9AGAR|nr:hypothetical protein CVT26_001160 [Gymnopilus dilepis]